MSEPPGSHAPLLTLEITEGQGANRGVDGLKRFRAAGGTIGRFADNDWVLTDPRVSGRHARIHYSDGVFRVEDAGSTNGVFLNSWNNKLAPEQSHVFQSGDLLLIEPYQIRVTIGVSAAEPSPVAVDPFRPPEATVPRVPVFPSTPLPIAELLATPGREWPREWRTAIATWVQQNVLLVLVDRLVAETPLDEGTGRTALEAADLFLARLHSDDGVLASYEPDRGEDAEAHFFRTLEQRFRALHLRHSLEPVRTPSGVHWLDRLGPPSQAPEPSSSRYVGRGDDAVEDVLVWPDGTGRPQPDRSGGGDAVEASVFGPAKLGLGDSRLIQVFVHRADHEDEARAAASEADEAARRLGYKTLALNIPEGTRLTFCLKAPRLQVQESWLSLTWTGRTEGVSFVVSVPDDCRLGMAIGSVSVSVNSVPIGTITFQVEVVELAVVTDPSKDGFDLVATRARRYRKAFISYASKDRNRVLARVQMLKPLGVDYFQDVMHLSPGDRWARQLYRHIDACDVFYLFWSSNAKASEWVMKEVQYAYDLKHSDDDAPPTIQPVPIEGPPPVPPPAGFEWLHLDDPVLYFRVADQPDL